MRSADELSLEGLLHLDLPVGRRLLLVLIHTLMVVSFFVLGFQIILVPTILSRYLIGSLIMMVGSIVLRILWWKNLNRTAAHMLGFLFVYSAIANLVIHGVRLPAVVSCFIGICLTGYLLGLRTALAYAGIFLAAFWGIFLAGKAGKLLPTAIPVQAWITVFLALTAFSSVFLAIPVRSLLFAHQTLSRERRRLMKSIQELDERSRLLEQDVEASTTDLRRVNEDLARFPLAVAHDLRSPLSALSLSVEMLGSPAPQDSPKRASLSELHHAAMDLESTIRNTLDGGRGGKP